MGWNWKGILSRPAETALSGEEEAARRPWTRHVQTLAARGIPEPGSLLERKPATLADARKLYEVAPSFADLLPWVEYLPDSQSLLLEDSQSVAAFFELSPIGTEGRETDWLEQARDALENALQDSFDELDEAPWVMQFFVQDETNWDSYLSTLADYVQPRAKDSAFTAHYLRFFAHHLRGIAKPGGLFEDTAVTRLPWRGQVRRVRLVIYRRLPPGAGSRRGQSPEQALSTVCERLAGGLANAGVKARRMDAADIHDWLLRWFNPRPSLLGPKAEDRERFYALTRYPEEGAAGALELASGDFAQRLFFGQPRSDVDNGLWVFDGMPHRVVVLDRLRLPPVTGHVTGETRKGGDAMNALFDQMPEDTLMCLTLVITPQDVLKAHLSSGQESRGRNARLGTNPPGRARGPRLDRRRAQALPGGAGLLSAREGCAGTRRARLAACQRLAQRRSSAGAGSG